MKKTLSSLTLIASLTFSATSMAGETAGKITNILTGPGHGTKLFITMDSTILSKPACATNPGYNFVLDTTAPGADAWITMLTLAYASDERVWFKGTGKCDLHGSVETFQNIKMLKP